MDGWMDGEMDEEEQQNNNKMESTVALTLEVGSVIYFKWTDANTAELIMWRVSNNSLFTGKKNTTLRAFELFVKEKRLEGKVTPAWVKKKWENLRQKYKDIKSLSMMKGDPLVAPWKWYSMMDQALSGELTLAHSLLSNLSNLSSTSSPFPVPVSSSGQDPPPAAKKRKGQYWLAALQELERRQEERERRAAEREEERERRAADREEERERRAVEREEERERQALEREKRREQELISRQDRWERELQAREERREREYREREEQRDREAAAREDRLFKLLETFMSKQYNMN